CADDDDDRREPSGVGEPFSTATQAAIGQDDDVERFSDSNGDTASEEIAEETVTIADGEIDSSTLDIELGTRVIFTNEGDEAVQLTMQRESSADELDGGRLSDVLSEELDAGDTQEHDFNQLGVYHLSSQTHPELAKTIRVHQY